MTRIAVIPGDGIGVEVTREALKVLDRVTGLHGLPLDWVVRDFGADRYLETGTAITEAELEDLETGCEAILVGALGDPRVPDHAHARDVLLGLRFRLDLYANVRPVKLYADRLSPLRDAVAGAIDFTIFRENTEGVYLGLGGSLKRGTQEEIAIQEDVNTRTGVERIVRAAFEHARSADGSRVTLADKANAMPHVGGLWRRVFAEIGAEYPDVEREALFADMLALDLVRRPGRYDIIVTSNLFGDILSDLAAALVGGLGLAASASLHPGRHALFEPVHGSAPDIAGTDRANPMAAILTVAMLLNHFGFTAEAGRVESAVRGAIAGGFTTPDLGGTLGTQAVGDWICEKLDRGPER